MSRIRALGVLAGITGTIALGASSAAASHQYLQWNENGDSFATFGADAEVRIYQGAIEFEPNCPDFPDAVFPHADVYVVRSGSVTPGGTLTDVSNPSGVPNTILGGSGGLFIDESIAVTMPSGRTGGGTYAVVFDECQDGKFNGSDKLFDPAFSVEDIPADVPPLPAGRIAALKAKATEEARFWADATQWHIIYLNLLETLGVATGLRDGFSKDGAWRDVLIWYVQDQIGLKLGDVKKAAILLLLNTARHWKGIAEDPPDPGYRQPTTLAARPAIDAAVDAPIYNALLALGEAGGTEAALGEGLLRSLERYQGAAIDGNGDWALLHARAIRENATLLAARLADTSLAIENVITAASADTRDVDAEAAALEVVRERVVAHGLSERERREAASLGFTSADIDAFRARLAELDFTGFAKADGLATLAELRQAHDASAIELAALADAMRPVIAALEADPAVNDRFPRVDAGGPYTGDEGVGIAFDGRRSASPFALPAFDWDLDGDGTFDDASGATPTGTYDRPQRGLVGLRVSADHGRVNFGYAALTVREVDARPRITFAAPAADVLKVEVGESRMFAVTATDPDGSPVSVSWEVDGRPTSTGSSFIFSPSTLDVGARSVTAVVDDSSPLGGRTRRPWSVMVVHVDADEDGWRADVDCDDDESEVNPDHLEVVGNGRDDDCDPDTHDGGAPPSPFFNASPDGGGRNVALQEAGATVHSSSGAISGHTPDAMLDFSASNLPWATRSGQTGNEWVKIGLAAGATYAIDRVQVMPRPNFADQRVRQFAIDVSTTSADDAAFTPVMSAATANNAQLQEFAFERPVLARYVRYRPISSHGGGGSCGGCISTQQLRVLSGQHGSRTVRFENLSTPGDSAIDRYMWEFGDGTTSTEPSPIHTFPAGAASYPVRLTAVDVAGQAREITLTQKVLTPPAVAFAFTPSGPLEGQTLNFVDQSIASPLRTIVARNWMWGDGTTASSPSHVFADNGAYPVALEVLDNAGEVGRAQSTVTVANAPPAVAVGNDVAWVGGKTLRTPVPVGPVTVSDPGSADTLTCRWDFGDGASSDACDFDHAYDHSAPWGSDAAPRVFDATLAVTDDDGDAGSDGLRITVRPAPVPSPDNLVPNGDFESPDVGLPTFTVKGPGGALGGWTIEPHSIDHINIYFADAASGGQSVDLNGSGRGAIHRDIATVPGQIYRLRFAMAGNIEGGPSLKAMGVLWDGIAVDTPTFNTTGRDRRAMGWRYHEYTVVATSTHTRLRFESLIDGVFGPFLDDVSLFPLEVEHPTATDLSCTPATVGVGVSSSCTATVKDTGATPNTPTGTVDFSNGASCTLAGLGSEAMCSIAFDPDIVGPNAITASYGGDANHTPSSASASVTVTVQPPTAAFAFTPMSPLRGQPVEFHDASTADTGGSVTGWAWDFGDGTQSTARSPRKTFGEAGTYRVRLEVTDSYGGTASSTADVVVIDNVSPDASAAGDQLADEGAPTEIDLGSFTDAGPRAEWSVDVDWGDGTPHTAFTTDETGALGTRPHTYADGPASHTVTVTVTDHDGLHDAATFAVTVANVAPTAVLDAGNDLSVQENSTAERTFRYRVADPGLDTVTSVASSCGESGTKVTGSDNHTDATGSFRCVFEDGPKSSTVSVRATDSDDDEGPPGEQGVHVANADPTAELLNDGPRPEGSAVTIWFARPTDASHADEQAGFRYGVACSPAASLPESYAAASTGSGHTCTFHDDGTHSVRGRILDRDGGSSTYTADVAVDNVAPTITSFTGTDSLFGPLAFAPSTFTATFTDPGTLDTHTALYEWSDATPEASRPLVTSPDTMTHTFTAAGCNRSATVTVTDKDGDADSATASVNVGTGTWLPPLTDQPVADKLRNGQVLPVKIRIADCNGVPVTGLRPEITLAKGDLTAVDDNSTQTVAVPSVSSADTSGVMRPADGHYLYNMRVSVASADLNSPYTIIVHPYGTSDPASLRHKIIATK